MSAAPPSPWSEHTAPDGRPYFFNSVTNESTWTRPRELMIPPLPPLPAGFPAVDHAADYAPAYGYPRGGYQAPIGYGPVGYTAAYGGFAGAPGPYGQPAPTFGPGMPIQKGRSASGPPGSNLFIFHIPNDVTNRDLADMFAKFGNVISARIMVERETGRSRGFGFVSYDNPAAADIAIRSMDGFQIGRKRLKVTHKKERTGGDGGSVGDGSSTPMMGGPGSDAGSGGAGASTGGADGGSTGAGAVADGASAGGSAGPASGAASSGGHHGGGYRGHHDGGHHSGGHHGGHRGSHPHSGGGGYHGGGGHHSSGGHYGGSGGGGYMGGAPGGGHYGGAAAGGGYMGGYGAPAGGRSSAPAAAAGGGYPSHYGAPAAAGGYMAAPIESGPAGGAAPASSGGSGAEGAGSS